MLGTRLAAECAIKENRLTRLIPSRVIQVNTDGGVTDLPSANARILKSLTEFAVLPSVMHAFVEAISRHNVIPVARSIVSVLGRARRGEEIKQVLLEPESRELIVLERPRHPVRLKPSHAEAATAQNIVSSNSPRQLHG